MPPVHGEAGRHSITGVRIASSPGPRPRADSRGLSIARKARACMPIGENSGFPRLGFRGIVHQGDLRGDADTARRGVGHRVSMDHPWASPTAVSLLVTAGCRGGPKSPCSRVTSPATGKSVLTGTRGAVPVPSAVSSRSPRCVRTPGSRASRRIRWRFLPPRSLRVPLNADPGANEAACTHGRREGPVPSSEEGAFFALCFY